MKSFRHSMRNPNSQQISTQTQVVRKENGSVRAASQEKASQHVMIALMIFNLIIGILTACMVLHLGLENSKRSSENLLLVNELKRLQNSPVSSQQARTKDPNSEFLKLTGSASYNVTRNSSVCYMVAIEALRIANEAKNYTRSLAPRQDSTATYRYYKNRMDTVFEAVKALESSQDFFRKQIHQRLGSIESASISMQRDFAITVGFHASLSRNLVATPRGGIIGFDVIGFNDGGGFTHGFFRPPKPGLYVITLNVIMILRPNNAYSGWQQPIKVTLRVNKKASTFGFQQPFVEETQHLTRQVTAVMRLKLDEVVDVFAQGFSKFSLAKGSSLCGALIRSSA